MRGTGRGVFAVDEDARWPNWSWPGPTAATTALAPTTAPGRRSAARGTFYPAIPWTRWPPGSELTGRPGSEKGRPVYRAYGGRFLGSLSSPESARVAPDGVAFIEQL